MADKAGGEGFSGFGGGSSSPFSLQPALSNFGGAVNDLFAADADRAKAAGYRFKSRGDLLEAQEYDLAQQLALQNIEYTKTSTDIKEFQTQRQIYQTIGEERADIAAGGGAEGGSALDILRSSAEQGSIATATLSQQGMITERAYQEQADSYKIMSEAAHVASDADLAAADAEERAAVGADIGAAIKGVAGVASLFGL